MVQPEGTVTILSDEADNRFIECADTSNTHFLITINRRDFAMIYFRKTRIVALWEFIEIVLGVDNP